MALNTLSAKKAKILLQQINAIRSVNQVLSGKVHRYLFEAAKELNKVTQPFNDKIEAAKKGYKIEIAKESGAPIFESPELEKEFNEEIESILASDVKVPLMKLDFKDIEQIGFPSNFNMSELYRYLINDAPVTEDEEVEAKEVKMAKV